MNKFINHIKKNAKTYINIIIAIIFAIIIFIRNTCLKGNDDAVYEKVFNSFSTFKIWAKEFYFTWSGRIITSALSNIFLRMPLVIFRICNTAVYIIAITSIFFIIKEFSKINDIRECIVYFLLYICSFIIDDGVAEQSIIWVVGSFNYLWPTAFMFVSMIPFIKILNDKEPKEISFVIFMLANIIACFAEQSALVLLTIGTLAIMNLLFTKKKIPKLLLMHYITIIVLTLIELLAPGNVVRSAASTLRRYPTFDMLSMLDRLLQGIIVLENQLLYNEILPLILTILVAINGMLKTNKNIFIRLSYSIPFICILIGKYAFSNITLYGIEYIYGVKIYIPVLIFTLIIVYVAYLLTQIFNMRKGILTSLFFLGGIASSLTLSFSPTIYASGPRIFFVMDLLFILVIGNLITEVLGEIKKERIEYKNKKIVNN